MMPGIKTVFYISLLLNFIILVLLQQNHIYIPTKDFIKSLYNNIHSVKINDSNEINIYDNNITISGLPFVSKGGALYRLPDYMKNEINSNLWKVGTYPSGGRIRFKTDSRNLTIVAKSTSTTFHHMTSIMKNGFDIYVNDIYTGSAWPNPGGEIRKKFYLGDNSMKNITIYLPLFASVELLKLYIDKNTQVNMADDLINMKPIVYYGSSITQGVSASNPGLSYQAIISRSTKIDFINFGFSGNGFGNPEIANLISKIDSSVIVLDYWANPTPDQYKKTLPIFISIIRKRKKTIPILIITPFYTIGEEKKSEQMKKIAFDFYNKQRILGDNNIFVLDGIKMFPKKNAFGLIDGLHLNSLGFWLSARALEPEILKILGI